MKAFRKALVYVFLATSALAYADAPQSDGNGGVTCNPGCGGMSCSGDICTVCNSQGCVQIPNSVAQ
jgi:hypothetical protein